MQTASNATRLFHGEGRQQLVASLEVDMTMRGEYFLDKIALYAVDDPKVDMKVRGLLMSRLALPVCVNFTNCT